VPSFRAGPGAWARGYPSDLTDAEWQVERTVAWISKHRRTVCDYESRPAAGLREVDNGP
jgi:hypothetical protein